MLRPKFIPSFLIPKPIRSESIYRQTLGLSLNLLRKYGWIRSMREKKCVDRSGQPIPWFTYPAIDYLKQMDYTDKTVFEYGAGFSTLFWASRAAHVIAVEHDYEWYQKVKNQMPPNCELLFASSKVEEYATQISSYGKFDIISIDGYSHTRPACSLQALMHIKPGGMIILDNSDLCLTSAAILRSSTGLIEVDFTGFAPLSSHAQTTSLFFTRDYDFKPVNGFQPHRSVAQPHSPWKGC